MTQLTAPLLQDLLSHDQHPPCVSIYVPMQRSAFQADENRIHFKNLLAQARESLARHYAEAQTQPLIDRIAAIPSDGRNFWTGPRDALAIFASDGFVRTVDLQHPAGPLCIVGDTFHIKPLIRILQDSQRYQLLALSLHEVRLFEGVGQKLEEIAAPHVPMSISEAVSDVEGSPTRRNASAGVSTGTPGQPYRQAVQQASVHNAEEFYRVVDQSVWEHHSRPSGLPLIVAAVESVQPEFRKASRNPMLMDERINLDPQRLPVERLAEEAWRVLQPKQRQRVETLKDQFQAARARQRGSDNLFEVATASAQGRVDTLLVQGDRQITGRFSPHTGMIEQAAPGNDPRGEDLLDELAETVLKSDGAVLVVPADQMPTDTGLAAIYRY